MKNLLLLAAISFCCILHSQNFEVIGGRNIGMNYEWDFPTVEVNYADADGNLYIFVSESSQPRTNELIRYDFENNSWTNITNNGFEIPGGASTSHGVGQLDGSILTVNRSFDGNQYSYTIFPDGNFTEIGGLPSSSHTSNIILSAAINPINNEFHYLSTGLNGAFVHKYNGEQWEELPLVENIETSGNTGTDIGFDQDGTLYVTFHGTDNFQSRVYRFNEVQWDLLFMVPGDRPMFHIASSTEIYLAVTTENGILTYLYDGNNFNTHGQSVPGSSSSILKAANDDLFLSTGEDDGFYKYSNDNNNWEKIINDNPDNLAVSGFLPQLMEANGFIYNSFKDNDGITTVKFTESVLNTNYFEEKNDFILYPNPVKDILYFKNLESIQNNNSKLTLFDINGKQLTSYTTEQVTNGIDLSYLTTGVYFVKIESPTSFKTIRLVKI